MANHKSAEKRARQSVKRKARNTQTKAAVKTFEKNLVKAIEAKSTKEIPELLKAYVKKAMSAVSKGSLKKQTVARKISRLSSKANTVASK